MNTTFHKTPRLNQNPNNLPEIDQIPKISTKYMIYVYQYSTDN